MNKLILTFLVMLSTSALYAQESFYKMPNGKIIDQTTYQKVKENLGKNGKVEELIITKIIRNDSIIITPKLNVLTQKDQNGNYIDPYGEQKKLIGTRFPIEKFKNHKGVNYAKTFLNGKPSLINFWFTTCVPCLAEIPVLNNLEAGLKDKVNFLAITFEQQQTVNSFLKHSTYKFQQITNAQQQLNELKVVAYPINFILNKDGIIIDVYGEISNSEKQLMDMLKELLVF